MDEREYIIENITKEEWEILEDNGIDWCPDDMFEANHDVIIFGEDEYSKAMKLLGHALLPNGADFRVAVVKE